jgi:hypothetical protein
VSWHNGPDLKTVLGVGLLLSIAGFAGALAGCRSDAPGIKNNVDAGTDKGGHLPRPDANCPMDAGGGGECPLNFCGQAKVGLPLNEFPQSGADTVCGVRLCRVGPELSTHDGFQLVCVDPNATGLAFGAACSPDPAQAMRCADDSLCITAMDFPQSPFCSTMCRNDADCPSKARCVEHPTPAALADGRQPMIGMCVPETKLVGTVCLREADCMPGQGCVLYGGRTNLRMCRAGGAKSLGTACTAATDCRSNQCYDHDFHVYGGQRTFCSGPCNVNSDCGPDQGCVRLLAGDNGSGTDPLDDLVVGYCRTLFSPLAATGCASDAACVALQNGSDTCDVTHGLCYRKAAVAGTACTRDTDCELGGACSVGARFVGGYCQTFGCDAAATSGVNACPGTNSACAQRGGPDEPISACYEKCTAGGSACSRASAGYSCEPATPTAQPSICLVGSGT